MTSFILEGTPRRLPRSLTCCVPSLTAHMLHAKLLREMEMDFAMLRSCRAVIPLSFTHEKLHLRSHSSAVASKLDLLRTEPHGSYAACETAKGEEDGFCDAVKFQDRNAFELNA